MGRPSAVAYLIAFSSGWKMTLVVTASIPLMVIAGGIQASVMTGFSSQVIMMCNIPVFAADL